MRKLLFMLPMLAALFVFSGCADDEEGNGTQTFFVNVYSKANSIFGDETDKELVNNAFVYLYQNENKTIDNQKSAESVVNDGVLTYSDGTKSSKPKYDTNFQPGVFNLENIENGNYILWVVYMLDYGSATYSSYKNITVNYDYRGTTEEKVFITSISDTGFYRFQNW